MKNRILFLIFILIFSVFATSCGRNAMEYKEEKSETVGFTIDMDSRIKLRSEQRGELLDRVEHCVKFWEGVEKDGKFKVLNVFKSDKDAYTQGIELDENGVIYQATGLKGKSGIGILNKENGVLDFKIRLSDDYFGEGITFTPRGVWQLTYKEKTAFLRDKNTLDVIETFNYDTEGWGIAYDKEKKELLMSDGTDKIFVRNSDNFELTDEFTLSFNGENIEFMNELEYADGYLYANIWQTYNIIKVDLKTRKVVTVYDFEKVIDGLGISKEDREKMNVLNGIAHIEGNRFYITGKMYPVLLEVELD